MRYAAVLKLSSNDRRGLRGWGYSLILGAPVALFYAYPLLRLALNSIGYTAAGFHLRLAIHAAVILEPKTWEALGNSARVALSVSASTTLVATTLAWLAVKTDLPFKKLVSHLVLLTFIVPSYILGLSWLQFFGRNGYLGRIIETLTHDGRYAFECYSVDAVIIVLSVHLYPLVFMAARNTFESQDPLLEQAAMMSGASPLRAAFGVTVPLAAPGILSMAMLTFSRALANFDVPALLALPVRKELLTTRVYTALNSLDLSSASALSMLLVAFSGLLFITSGAVIGRRDYSGSGTARHQPTVHRLGKMKGPVTALVLLFLAATAVLPLLTILTSSFLKRWGLPLHGEYLTLNNYVQMLFVDREGPRAFRNSLLYGVAGASGAAVVACGVAFCNVFKTWSWKVLKTAASWSIASPNIVLAVAAILSWNSPRLRLYGTPWAIIVTYMILFTPMILGNIGGSITNQDADQLRAAQASGASPMRTYLDIVLPALAPGLKAGWVFCLLIAMREIPISLLLYGPGQNTVGVLLFGMQSQSYGLEMTSAISAVVMILLLGGNLALKIMRRGIGYARGAD